MCSWQMMTSLSPLSVVTGVSDAFKNVEIGYRLVDQPRSHWQVLYKPKRFSRPPQPMDLSAQQKWRDRCAGHQVLAASKQALPRFFSACRLHDYRRYATVGRYSLLTANDQGDIVQWGALVTRMKPASSRYALSTWTACWQPHPEPRRKGF